MGDSKRLQPSSSCNLSALANGLECWLLAEQKVNEILCTIQPTVDSDKKRSEVIDYIHGLLRSCPGTQVFVFGSVPLKTYLPDGDIDLTIVSSYHKEEDLAQHIRTFLENEAQKGAKCQISDIQYIPAQVKVLKCTVQSLSVDITFNQVAGLCALSFLEQADQLIGKNHLFKRSIILIKAWCYYESRVLGAYYGLISTYALEIMVLHIINVFHISLHGPLSVLYQFLHYYSSFDWDACCVTLTGPIPISSLPEVGSVKLETHRNDLLLNEEFLRYCRDIFSIPSGANETTDQEFSVKYLNILDPLKFSNNLGRSVGKGNARRITRAFSLGAQKLEEIFMLPKKHMVEELPVFFLNTLERNGRGQRADVEVSVPVYGSGACQVSDLKGDCDGYFSSMQHDQWAHSHVLLSPRSYQSPLVPSSLVMNNTTTNGHYELEQIALDASYGDLNLSSLPMLLSWPFQDLYPSHIPFVVEGKTVPSGARFDFMDIGINGRGKSRGIGTYIPDIEVLERVQRQSGMYMTDAYSSYPKMNSSRKGRSSEFGCHEVLLAEPRNSDLIKAFRTDKRNQDHNPQSKILGSDAVVSEELHKALTSGKDQLKALRSDQDRNGCNDNVKASQSGQDGNDQVKALQSGHNGNEYNEQGKASQTGENGNEYNDKDKASQSGEIGNVYNEQFNSLQSAEDGNDYNGQVKASRSENDGNDYNDQVSSRQSGKDGNYNNLAKASQSYNNQVEAVMSGCSSEFILSLEDFPLLPYSKDAAPPDSALSGHLTLETVEFQEASSSMQQTSQHPSFAIDSSSEKASDLPESESPVSIDSLQLAPSMAVHGAGNNMIPERPYHLADEKDFPPLSLRARKRR